jgi:hypothetical protein
LGAIDLIRNYLFTWIDKGHQNQYYENYWKPIEKHITQLNAISETQIDFLEYIRAIFAIREVNVIENKEFDYLLKSLRSNNPIKQNEQIQQFLIALREFWDYYLILKGPYKDNALPFLLKKSIERIRFIPYNYHIPILIKILKEFEVVNNPNENVQKIICNILTLFETYYIRKYICDESLVSSTDIFNGILFELNSCSDKQKYLQIIRDKINPDITSKEEFKNSLLFDPLYQKGSNNSLLKLVLYAIEQKKSASMTTIPSNYEQLSIEHVMPQKLNETWISSNIDDRDRVHALWCNSLGNLTLVTKECNAILTNRSFLEKKKIYKRHIGYLLMDEIVSQEFWGEREIENRGRVLTDLCLEIWDHDGVGPKTKKPKSGDKIISCSIKGREKKENLSNWIDLFKYTITCMYDENNFQNLIKNNSKIISIKQDNIKNCKSLKISDDVVLYYKSISGPIEVYKYCKKFVKEIGWKPDYWSGEALRKEENESEPTSYLFK